jgi:hypothetical protein
MARLRCRFFIPFVFLARDYRARRGTSGGQLFSIERIEGGFAALTYHKPQSNYAKRKVGAEEL